MLRSLLALICGTACVFAPPLGAQQRSAITIKAARAIDGAGGVVDNAMVTVQDES